MNESRLVLDGMAAVRVRRMDGEKECECGRKDGILVVDIINGAGDEAGYCGAEFVAWCACGRRWTEKAWIG